MGHRCVWLGIVSDHQGDETEPCDSFEESRVSSVRLLRLMPLDFREFDNVNSTHACAADLYPYFHAIAKATSCGPSNAPVIVTDQSRSLSTARSSPIWPSSALPSSRQNRRPS